jgi:hypothetical protein
MNILEMFNESPTGYRDEKEDNTPLSLNDLRKTKLTLKQLNRLRIMNDVRRLEHEQKLDKIRQQYKVPNEQPQM